MSDQATGGDGSVRWSVDIDNARHSDVNHQDNGRLRAHGVDKSGNPGDPFTVSIRVPHGFRSVDEYLKALTDPANADWGVKPDPNGEMRVYFNLPIERMTPDQIRVSWGASSNVVTKK